MKEFSIDRNTEGQRIDRYLSDELEDRSRSYIQKIRRICKSQPEACKIQLQAFFWRQRGSYPSGGKRA